METTKLEFCWSSNAQNPGHVGSEENSLMASCMLNIHLGNAVFLKKYPTFLETLNDPDKGAHKTTCRVAAVSRGAGPSSPRPSSSSLVSHAVHTQLCHKRLGTKPRPQGPFESEPGMQHCTPCRRYLCGAVGLAAPCRGAPLPLCDIPFVLLPPQPSLQNRAAAGTHSAGQVGGRGGEQEVLHLRWREGEEGCGGVRPGRVRRGEGGGGRGGSG